MDLASGEAEGCISCTRSSGILLAIFCDIDEIPRGKTRTSIRGSALMLASTPTKSMSQSSKIAKRTAEIIPKGSSEKLVH